jgi:hypothetical protein
LVGEGGEVEESGGTEAAGEGARPVAYIRALAATARNTGLDVISAACRVTWADIAAARHEFVVAPRHVERVRVGPFRRPAGRRHRPRGPVPADRYTGNRAINVADSGRTAVTSA